MSLARRPATSDGGQHGWTLIELMIATAVVAIFAGAVGGLAGQGQRAHRAADGYARDLRECRTALQALETDLRRAARLVVVDHGADVLTPDGWVAYRLAGGRLTRDGPAAGCRTIASCVEAFEVRARDALAHVVLQLRRRSRSAPRDTGTITMQIFMRNRGGD